MDSSLIRLSLLSTAVALAGCFDSSDLEPNETEDDSGDTTASATTDPATTDPQTTDPDSSGDPPPPATDSTTTDPADSSSSGPPPASCGDGTIDDGETCDDANTDDGDGCSAMCQIDEGWICDDASPTICTTECGDGMVGAPVEECDDGNETDNDDCTNACTAAACGDGVIWMDNEVCDDGNTDLGDGCSDACEWETGFVCDGSPSSCFYAVFLADGTSGTAGSLWAMSLDGVTTLELGPLTTGLTGMAFHPNGTLYGVTTGGGAVPADGTPGASNNGIGGLTTGETAGGIPPGGAGSQLGRIDLATLEFIPIGPLVDAAGSSMAQMPDIAFMGDQLVGWSENGDDLALIDATTGLVTRVASDRSSYGTGMAYNSANDTIVLAPDGSGGFLYIIDEAGGVTTGPSIMGTFGNVRGLSFYGGQLYGLDVGFGGGPVAAIEGGGGGGSGNVVTYDPTTGALAVLATLPSGTLDAVAVYDPGNTP